MSDQVKGLIFIQLEDLPCVSVKELSNQASLTKNIANYY